MNTQEQIEGWEAQREEAANSLRMAVYYYLSRREEIDPDGTYPKTYEVQEYSLDNYDDYGYIDFDCGDQIEVSWSGERHCGCCAPDRYSIRFPKSHLWDPDWEEKFLAEQAEAKRLEEEEERLKKEKKEAEKAEKEKAQLRKLMGKYPNELLV